MRGAEAILEETSIIGRKALVKRRIQKGYRISALDDRLRKERTKIEARLLHKAKLAGVECPTVLEVWDFSITLSMIDGKRPVMIPKYAEQVGGILAKLHKADIIHGDFTPANVLVDDKDKLHVIDFGLGSISKDIEDKAVDAFTMLQVIKDNDSKKAFIRGYSSYDKSETVMKQEQQVASRVRYAR